ncbi:chloride channel protein [Achromobacter aloeverae]|uniref:Chloride channel protein n=1 Tax=Achromobacter aloeverae TaxID=1750518 RepID=A0A4V1MRM1_9BURK|nr:chloride channel protein [Achromobacter aloeverae]RXN85121.1 chloride channel protein [Achromobacter aloeverae]
MKIPRFFRTSADASSVKATERGALIYVRGLLVAAAMGALGALAAQAFRSGLDNATTWLFGREGDISQVFAALPWYVRIACPAVGAAIAALILAQALRREHAQGTVSEYLETIDGKTDRIPVVPSLLRCVSSFFSIVSGGSIGKEGAMVQLSATAASWLCYPFRALGGAADGMSVLRGEDFRLAVALAATGGLAAVYHTPLAAAIFIAEIAYGGLELRRVGFLFTAAAAATWVVSAMGHYTPLYALPPFAFDVTGPGMLAIMLVGVAAGASGAIFLWVLRLARTGFTRLHGSLVVRMTVGGLLVGLITLVAPDVTGNGFAPIVKLLDGQALSTPLLVLLALKILATAATVGAGAIGGLFTPSLMIGALAGSACAPLAAQWLGVPDSAVLLGVAGMAAGLAATTQAPLMSTLMVFEMTQESSFVFPLMLATVVAYATSMALGDSGTYSVIARHRARSDRRSRLADATAGAVMRPVARTVARHTPLRVAMEVGLAGKNRFVFVVDDARHYEGAVWLQDVVARVNAGEADAAIDTSAYVPDLPVVYAHQRLFDVWQTVVESPAERTPVLSDPESRRLVGVLNKSELLKQARLLFA